MSSTPKSTPSGPLAFVSRALAGDDDHDVVRALLDVAAGGSVPARSITGEQLRTLRRHRVVPLIPTDWTVEGETDLSQARRSISVRQLRLYAALEDVVDTFTQAGIELRVLKGLATSRLDYERPSMRQTADVDVLVPTDSLDRAVELLLGAGGTIFGPDTKGLVIDMPSGVQVDLHNRITKFSEQPEELLFADPEPVPGSAALALPAELRLVHAAAHLLYSPPTLRRISGLADISAIRARTAVDLERARSIAAELGIERIAGAALRLERAIRGLEMGELDAWAQPNRLERLSFVRTDRRILAEHLLALSALDGARLQARYLIDSVFPPADVRNMRGGTSAYFRRLLPSRFGGQNIRRAR